jgi:hypothetical protein
LQRFLFSLSEVRGIVRSSAMIGEGSAADALLPAIELRT